MTITLLAISIFSHLARNWAIVAFASTTVILVVVPALILAKYVRISLNIMRSTKPPLARNPLDFDRLRGDTVTFPAFDGLPLAGMIVRGNPDGPCRGLILFAHEFCADMQSCARYCRPLVDVGFDILTFDFRGHGQSECEPDYAPRQWVTEREIHDIRGAAAFAQGWLAEQGRPPRFGVVGISRGACAAILLAAENPAVAAIVADGAYSTDTTIEYFMKRWAYIFATLRVVYENHPPAFWRLLRWSMMLCARREFRCSFPSVRKAIARMTPRPILFIHGERDSYLPTEQSRRLYALAAQPKALWIAAAARHNQAAVLHPQRYARLTIGFLAEHVTGLPPDEARAVAAAVGRPGALDPAPADLSAVN
jgi:pimeloyl-ACP methyl ester carboxylesterase